MLIRLIPPSPHSAILYGLSFPNVLPLETLGPGAVPPAWSSQLQILTSFLQLETPSSIHMLDRAVGLVTRTREVSMNVPLKEIVVKFVDGRVVNIPMNSDCVRILSGVVLDVKGCRDSESQRGSMEGSACSGSMAGGPEGPPSSPTKSLKPGKHKRQRSLLFSLISSLVPKSLSSSSPSSPPPTAPPPTPLPPLPAGRLASPISSQRSSFTSDQVNPERLRQRARAMLIDVWRRHILTALPPQHLPAAGYAEWILLSMASKVRAELESVKAAKMWSDEFGVGSKRSRGSRHRQTQSEGRNALDFGDRSEDHEAERCRAPSPFPDTWDAEDGDQVVYPRRDQADEWGVRYVDYPGSYDNADIFEVEFNGYNDSLLAEHFTVGDEWDDNEQLTFELTRTRHHVAGTNTCSSRAADLALDYVEDDSNRLADTTFDMSSIPLIPSDVNDGEDSDDSQMSLRTPEEGEELPLAPPVHVLQGTMQLASYPAQSSLVSRVTSSRPRPRSAPPPRRLSHSSSFHGPSSSSMHDSDFRDAHVDEIIYSHCEHLDRICTALEIVRSRAREEGWRLVRATTIGANGWMDDETERTLELKAKRRAWSSGIKIHAPYSSTSSASQVWDGKLPLPRSPLSPPGLTFSSKRSPRGRGPIVPTGLSLGIPLQSSPLAMYVRGAESGKPSIPGILNTAHRMEAPVGRRSSRVTFADSAPNLFPVCEDENEDEDSFPPVQASAVGFPQAVSPVVSVNESEVMEEPRDNEDDPFCIHPLRPRTRTTSMYVISPTSTPPSSPVIPMFRPSTPPPSYQAAVGGDVPTAASDEEKRLDASALLLQPLSSLSISPSHPPPSRPQLTCNPQFIPRPRSVSLPSTRPCSSTNKNRRTSFHHDEEHCDDLSRTYASPPPDGPLVISAAPAPREKCPRYAHVPLPVPAGKKNMNASVLTRTGKEVVFEQAGSEFTLGIEVALGRAEEGRVVW